MSTRYSRGLIPTVCINRPAGPGLTMTEFNRLDPPRVRAYNRDRRTYGYPACVVLAEAAEAQAAAPGPQDSEVPRRPGVPCPEPVDRLTLTTMT
eukprot:748271-Hanusia_phi.AAC.1